MTHETQDPAVPCDQSKGCAHSALARRLAAALRDELHMHDPAASHSTDEYSRITAARRERLDALAAFAALDSHETC